MGEKAAMDRRYEMTFLHAAADGVGPALLLSAPKGAAQYLFNVPEGFARLALEKKMRPSSHLSCVCLTSIQPHTAGGLGGLVLRLAQDGHGQIQLVGPQGSAQFVHALRHICRWRHPKVFISECHSNQPLPVFDDDHTVIIPLMAGDQSYSCPWFSYKGCKESAGDYLKSTTSTDNNIHSTNPPRKKKRACPGCAEKVSMTSSNFHSFSSNSSSDNGLNDVKDFDINDLKRFEKGFEHKTGQVSFEKGQSRVLAGMEGLCEKEITKNNDLYSQGPLTSIVTCADSPLLSGVHNNQVFCELDALFVQHGLSRKILKHKTIKKLKSALKANASSSNAYNGRQIHQTGESILGSNTRKDISNYHCTHSTRFKSSSLLRGSFCEPEGIQGVDRKPDLKSNYSEKQQICKNAVFLEEVDLDDMTRKSLVSDSSESSLTPLLNRPSTFDAEKSVGVSVCTDSHPLFSMLDAIFSQTSCGKKHLKRKTISTLKKATKCSHSRLDHCKVCDARPTFLKASKQSRLGPKFGCATKSTIGTVLDTSSTISCQSSDVASFDLKSSFLKPCSDSGHVNVQHKGQPLRKDSDGFQHLLDQGGTEQSKVSGTDVACKWLISNSAEHELPSLQEDFNPVYLKDLSGLSAVDLSETKKLMVSGQPNHSYTRSPIMGYLCFLKKLHAGVLIVDCCSNESLTSIKRFSSENHDKLDGFHKIIAVIHLTPFWFQRTEHYKLWMKTFKKSVLHLSARGCSQELGFLSSLSTSLKLNLVSDRIFPLPFATKRMVKDHCKGSRNQGTKKPNKNIKVPVKVIIEEKDSKICTRFDDSGHISQSNVFAAHDHLLHVRPDYAASGQKHADMFLDRPYFTANQQAAFPLRKELLYQRASLLHQEINKAPSSHCLKSQTVGSSQVFPAQDTSWLSSEACTKDLPIGEHYVEQTLFHEHGLSLPECQPSCSLNVGNASFEVVFLGTGSAEPNKYRGSSGILLKTTGCNSSILLDAGEGVVGQLVRMYGKKGASEVLASVSCLWVSHKHADHVLGVYSVLCARQGHGPLTIIGPSAVKNWLLEVLEISSNISPPSPYHYIHSKEFCVEHQGTNPHPTSSEHRYQIHQTLDKLQLRNIKTVYVDHCYEAFGLILFSNSGWSVVYSGDTRPCEQLIQAGIGCTLLIHEATFQDNLIVHAMQKRHSTVGEAINMAVHMHAQNVVLTHFSQRYPKIVNVQNAGDLNIFLAFDGMVVSSIDLKLFKSLLPLVSIVLEEDNVPCHDLGNSKLRAIEMNNVHGMTMPDVSNSLNFPVDIVMQEPCFNDQNVLINNLLKTKGVTTLPENFGSNCTGNMLVQGSMQDCATHLLPNGISRNKNEGCVCLQQPGSSTHIRWVDSD